MRQTYIITLSKFLCFTSNYILLLGNID